jgi:hypothetical protein
VLVPVLVLRGRAGRCCAEWCDALRCLSLSSVVLRCAIYEMSLLLWLIMLYQTCTPQKLICCVIMVEEMSIGTSPRARPQAAAVPKGAEGGTPLRPIPAVRIERRGAMCNVHLNVDTSAANLSLSRPSIWRSGGSAPARFLRAGQG